jgi:hypothetical protein
MTELRAGFRPGVPRHFRAGNFLPEGGIENSPGAKRSGALGWSEKRCSATEGAFDSHVQIDAYPRQTEHRKPHFQRESLVSLSYLWKEWSVAPPGLDIFFYPNPGLRYASHLGYSRRLLTGGTYQQAPQRPLFLKAGLYERIAKPQKCRNSRWRRSDQNEISKYQNRNPCALSSALFARR